MTLEEERKKKICTLGCDLTSLSQYLIFVFLTSEILTSKQPSFGSSMVNPWQDFLCMDG